MSGGNDMELKEINKENYLECIKLKVYPNQENFVATNSFSLLESHYEGNCYPYGIYDEGVMVGFLMYAHNLAGTEYPIDSWWMQRLMIDCKYQRKGYGKQAIMLLLEYIKSQNICQEFYTSAEPANAGAIMLYEKLGFVRTGEIVSGEIVLKIKF